ncbi:MAG: hypothetical protein PHW15_01805 [Patescibacteria group bacterium]|jgi:diacylglycerol kinase family enzyme|nr:hypothetical protein [Patescibacteria group bacterium]MDD5172783.1 hypothetical protein [Patescibacteria group bacterium]
MYFYIYDSFLAEKKYLRILSKIETRLASLDIAGKKYQLSILRSVKEIVDEILTKESPTIIVVGGDQTFYQAALAAAGTSAVLGFIPTEQDSLVAGILGLPINECSCDIISARRIEEINTGRINNERFFSSIIFEANKTTIKADEKYEIVPQKIKLIKVINLDMLCFDKIFSEPDWPRLASNPKDNQLEVLMGTPERKLLFFKKKEKRDSLFFVKKLEIKSKKHDQEILIKVDRHRTVKTPAVVKTAKEKINLIVGKDRIV